MLDQNREKIIVALDMDASNAMKLAQNLQGYAVWLKVGMTLYYEAGPEIVKKMKEMGFKIFLDLKLHDIPHQVQGAAYSAACTGADLLSVHALGGSDMIEAARKGVAQAFSETGQKTQLVAITVLTSMNADALKAIGICDSLKDEVQRLERVAIEGGADGIVCSAQEASEVKKRNNKDILIVTPGIRPQSSDVQDQSRVMTPSKALKAGSTHLVIGRPITQSQDPLQAFHSILSELNTTC